MIIRKPSDPIAVNAIKALFYGQPGVGKTTFAFTAPRPLLIDFDKGVRRVDSELRGVYGDVETWDDVVKMFNYDLSAYDTIIMDTVGKALDMLAQDIMRKDSKMGYAGDLTIKGYGVLKNRFKMFLERLNGLKKHVIMIAHNKESKDKDEIRIRPDITGQSLGNIIRECDLVGYMRAHNNVYTITFTPSEQFIGKNSCSLPEHINMRTTKLTDILEVAMDNMNKNEELAENYLKQINQIEEILAKCLNAEDLNAAAAAFKEITFISDAKVKATKMMEDKTQQLGCVWDKKTKKYQGSSKVQAA